MDRSLREIGAWCAVLTTGAFVVGIVLMASSGVQVLIPDTGQAALDWVGQVDDAGGLFFAGAWLVVLGGFFGVVAIVGFYDALKEVGRALLIAPVLAVVSLTLVNLSHLIPIAMGYRLVPGYVAGGPATRASLEVVLNTLASLGLVINFAGDFILWGVVVPLFAFASLKTALVPRWISYVGIAAAVLAGWLGVLSPASSVIEGLTFIGFVAFFVWTAAMGVALLRRPPLTAAATQG